ncbi:MAG: serine/threonine-protein kinase [Dehalococcoidia bacterium]
MVDEPTRPADAGPERIANYRLGRIVGQGGWGVVYEATNTRNDERVALKLLHAHLEDDESYLERFQREAQVATLLRSPYTVQLLDFGVDQGRHFLVMNYVDGETLSAVLRRGPLTPERALRIASQIGFALEEAEARRVVHRDIKPDNVMLDAEGTAQVLDFGIARQTGRQTLTATGAFVGTIAYAAPEVSEGRADHRSDLYSLGVTLFHALTGERPFHGEMLELLRQHRESPMPRGPLAGLDGEIIDAVARLMEKDPDDRYETASEAAGVLEHLAARAAARGDVALEMEPTEALGPGGTGVTSLLTMVIEPRGRSRRFVPRGAVTNYELVLRNDADEAIAIHLEGSDSTDSCRIVVPETVAVPAHAQSLVTISVAPRRRRWFGATEARAFRVAASGDDDSPPIVAAGEFRDQPEGLVAIGGALFSIGLLGVLAVLLGLCDSVLGTGDAALVVAGPAPPSAALNVPAVAGASIDQQGAIELDEAVTGEISAPGEVDSWLLFVLGGQVVSFSVEATGTGQFEPYLEVVIPDGPLLLFASGEGGEAYIDAVQFDAAGQYLVRVRGLDGTETGRYQLELFEEQVSDRATTVSAGSSGGTVAVGGVAFGVLPSGAVAEWVFTAEGGVQFSLGVESYVFAPFDPLVELIGPDGSVVGRDGSVGSGGGWLDNVTLPDDGEYVLWVSALDGQSEGAYLVYVDETAPSAGLAPTAPPAVTSVRVVVLDDEARFLFVMDTEQEFRWNQQGTDQDSLELGWWIELPLDGRQYDFALTHWYFGDSEQRGNLETFLAGQNQLVIFETLNSVADIVAASGLSASVAPGGLELVLGDPRFVQLLRTERPATLQLSTPGSLQGFGFPSLEADVEYLDSGPPSSEAPASTATPTVPLASARPAPTAPPTVSSPPAVTSVGAVVRDSDARFLFAMDSTQEFNWYLTRTDENLLELSWVVALPIGGSSYELSVMLFKFPGATQRQGSLSVFMNDAQVNLWDVQGTGHVSPTNAAVSASVLSNGLELVLADSSFVTLLRTERPTSVQMSVGGTLQTIGLSRPRSTTRTPARRPRLVRRGQPPHRTPVATR